jgi:hypothetical protein
MTTLGKTLVFLTFLAALAMGGLMIYFAKTSANWPAVVKDRDEHIAVLKANAEQEKQSRAKWVNEAEKLKQQLDAALTEARAEKQRLILERDEKEKQRKIYELEMGKANMALEQAKKEAVRLQSELNFTLSVVEAREKSIVQLQQEIIGHINAAQAAKNERDTAVARALALFEQLKQKEVVIQDLFKKLQPTTALQQGLDTRSPDFKNPPPVFVEGTIESVDKTLVKISLGSDQGVLKDHTLEVYRMKPDVKYLGRIIVINADFRHSMARLIPQPGVPVPTLLVGDEVASKLNKF